jgi:tRNA(Ile)-lysidine synthase
MTVSERALDAIHRHALLRAGDRVVVGLSGGSDSVALLRILRELEEPVGFTIVAAAHVNHGLRAAAERDEAFCRALADEVGVAYRVERIDVRARAERCGISIEDAGRRARYEMFDRVADELGATAIATGHTRDDQAETFLLRLLRGAGPRGLAGIHPKVVSPSGSRIRPLLEIGRGELREYLAAGAQHYCEDETNADVTIPRNRVRHELLPFIEARFSPEITAILAREAAIARADEDRLQQEAIDLAHSIVLTSEAEESVQIDVLALRSLHPALAGRVARLALERGAPGRFVGHEHIERLLERATSPHDRGSLSLPGLHVERRGTRLVLSREPLRPFSNSFQVSLSIPGEVVLPGQGWAVSASAEVDGTDLDSGFTVRVRGITPPLTVRSRQPGDRYKPFGMQGRSKKLQDLLVDRKIARAERDALPLVVDGSERIVWVVGEPAAEDFRVTAPSQGVIFLKARRLGGQG